MKRLLFSCLSGCLISLSVSGCSGRSRVPPASVPDRGADREVRPTIDSGPYIALFLYRSTLYALCLEGKQVAHVVGLHEIAGEDYLFIPHFSFVPESQDVYLSLDHDTYAKRMVVRYSLTERRVLRELPLRGLRTGDYVPARGIFVCSYWSGFDSGFVLAQADPGLSLTRKVDDHLMPNTRQLVLDDGTILYGKDGWLFRTRVDASTEPEKLTRMTDGGWLRLVGGDRVSLTDENGPWVFDLKTKRRLPCPEGLLGLSGVTWASGQDRGILAAKRGKFQQMIQTMAEPGKNPQDLYLIHGPAPVWQIEWAAGVLGEPAQVVGE